MIGETMSDWLLALRVNDKSDIAERFNTRKLDDLKRLRESSLPQFDWFDCQYTDFNVDNGELLEFFSRYKGVCVRALPNLEGLRRRFTRKYKLGFLSLNDCMKFARENVQEPYLFWDISLSEWQLAEYGFILQSGPRLIRAEIGKRADDLSHGRESPLASLIIDKAICAPSVNDKRTWLGDPNKTDEKARIALLRALSHIRIPEADNLDPYYWAGYFEGVVTQEKKEVRFLDYKLNKAYQS